MKNIITILVALVFINTSFCKSNVGFGKQVEFKNNPLPKLLKFIFLPITSFLPIWGSYDEGSYTNENTPLLNFDRTMDVNAERQRLIDRIAIVGTWERKVYEIIFRDAKIDLDNDKPQNNAIIAKNAAFVYWLGVDRFGQALPSSGLNSRQWFYNRVNEIIQGWEGKNLSFKGKVQQVWRAKENMVLMQAEDYLEASYLQNSALYSYSDKKKNKDIIAWFTYELYSNANNLLSGLFVGDLGGALHINNNMNLIVSASIGTGAIVLHKRKEFLIEVQKHPKRWASSAHAHINDLMWYNYGLFGKNNSLSKKVGEDELSPGFAEGGGYFGFTFINMIPFFQAFENFTNGAPVRFGPYHKRITSVVGEYMNNYMLDADYEKLFDWYIDIQMPNGFTPTIDDTWNDGHKMAILALTGKKKHKSIYNITQNLIESDYAPDFLIHVKELDTKPELPELVNNRNAGNLVWRQNADSMHNRHYLMFNVEDGTALNGGNPKKLLAPTSIKFKNFPNILSDWKHITWGHEHADLGNFVICGGEDQLIIDPPYFGDKVYDNFDVNQAHHHNIVLADGEGPEPDEGPVYANARKVTNDYIIMDANYSYWNRLLGVKTDPKASLNREIEILNDGPYPIYVINDWVKNKELVETFPVQYNLNGNGLESENTFTLLKPNVAVWSHPCVKDDFPNDNYKVVATFSSFFEGRSASNVLSKTTNSHGNKSVNYNLDGTWLPGYTNALKSGYGNIGRAQGTDYVYGEHTTIFKEFSLTAGDFVNFKTTIQVLPCHVNLDGGLVRANEKYNLHTISPIAGVSDFHVTRTIYTGILDTIINPRFNGDTNEIIATDAQSALFSFSNEHMAKFGSCISETNFKKCRIRNGKRIDYNDTIFIELSTIGEAFYGIIGKMKYDAYVEIDTACSVKFFIPDGITGYQMTIKNDTIFSSYNDTTKILTATFPKPGFYRFVMELADPCLMSCFFPLTADSIKNTFHFYEGTYEYLAHDLDIIADTGQLLITHGSRMHICQNYTLVNNDSIVLKPYVGFNAGLGLPMATAMSGGEGLAPNHLNYLGSAFTNLPNEKRTSIIVDNKAALVLDSGSYMHIGVNCLLWIKKGGTLLVKKGALLEVGSCGVGYDNISCGGVNKGTVIIDDSAFICVEDSAMLRFFKLIGDTVDRNIFFISTHPDKPALAGVNKTGASGKFNASDWNGKAGRFYNHNCIELCSLHVVNPPDVVHNEPWGWCNYNNPKSSFIVRSPYCVNDTVYLEQSDKSLNETRTIIQIFQHDTLTPIRTGSAETFRFENYFKINFFNFDSPDVYYIRVITINSCGISDTLTRSVNIIGSPIPSFTLNSTDICPGKNNLYALFNSGPFTNYFWHVHAIDPSYNQIQAELLNKQFLQYGADWEMDSTASDTFHFNDFYFYGGLKYAVSLTTKTICETKTIWDTIEVQPGAFISLSRPNAYATPINGATSVQLNGFISVADSFRWEPEIWLNRTDTNVVVSTPLDSIHYILIAKYGECTSTDTTFIKYNHIANSGVNDTICFTNDTAILGNSYDMSIFLGYLYYKGGVEFYNLYSSYTSTNPAYFRYLTHFLMHNEIMGQWLQCGTPIMDKFKNQVYRQQILKEPWFKTYYSQLTQFTDLDMAALDLFVDGINSNYELAANIDAQGSWVELEYCASELFNYYDNFLTSHLTEVSSSWVAISNGDTAMLSAWDEYFVAAVNPMASTSYIQTVITPQLAEIDEVTIFRDTILVPYFYNAMQFDSTVYFGNATSPYSEATSFSWNFGDGSPLDFNEFPIHTFPAFDSSFIVCMTAINKCGSFEYCDTIRVDSSLLNNQRVDYTYSHGADSQNEKRLRSDKHLKNIMDRPEIFLTNYPNPFSDQTIIDYQIWQSYSNATLIVTNTLGQVVFEQKLIKPINKVLVDGNLFPNGLYYYSIVIDQSTKLTKMMSVMH